MRLFLGVICLGLAASAGAGQAATASGPVAVVHQFIDTFNKGDVNGAAATHAAGATIIDEVPPHIWTGDGVVKTWAADLEKNDKAAGISGDNVKLGKASRVQVDGDTGYVVVPATYTYKQHGKAMVETASMTFALHKDADAWKITGWSWNGATPHAAAPKAATAKPADATAAPAKPAAAPAKPK
jgi:hypothetical protein